MKYYKNTELAKLYNISEKSVRNWIEGTQSGRLDLELFESNGKQYIANTSRNVPIIEDLVKKGKKYKNSRGFKTVIPSSKFYELYTPKQVVDIISNLDVYRELPIQYSYFNGGADGWDRYTTHLLDESTPNALTSTIQLLDWGIQQLDAAMTKHSQLNIVDIGVGNALPVRKMVEHFVKAGKLKRYIGIDISRELLDIAEHNLRSWFGADFPFEGHIRDINYERFDDLIAKDSFDNNGDSTANIILFLGGTINNFRAPNHSLTTIHDSMGKHDLFLLSKKLDTERSRRYFDIASPGFLAIDMLLDLLGINKSYYSIEQIFDGRKMAREICAHLNVAVSLEFELYGQRRSIEINKGESILLWRASHQDIMQTITQVDNNGFELLHSARSTDQDYTLLTSKIKTNIYL